VGAELVAVKPDLVHPADPDLALILECWAGLPAAVRSGIVAMVKATAAAAELAPTGGMASSKPD